MLKKLLLLFVGGPIVLILVFALLPAVFGSSEYGAGTKVIINADPVHIYPDVATLATWPEWTVWTQKRDPQCKHEFPDPKIGKGAKWIWKDGKPLMEDGLSYGQMTITAADPKTGIEFEMQLEDFSPMSGAIKFAKKGDATEVSWNASGKLDNYVFKAMVFYMGTDQMVAEQKECLDALKVRAEKRAGKMGQPVEAAGKKK